MVNRKMQKSIAKSINIKYIIILFFIIGASEIKAAPESDYVKANCKGQIEFVLPDRTRIDCLTETHAIEYDFGSKWAESVGQSLHYAMWTGRKAGIVLITNKQRYIKRLKNLVSHYNLPIDIWIIKR